MMKLSLSRRHLARLAPFGSIATILLLGTLGGPAGAQAPTLFSLEEIGASVGIGEVPLKTRFLGALGWYLGLASLFAFCFIVWGGILWMTSAGEQEKIDHARRILMWSCIGLVVVILAWAMTTFVFHTGANVTRT